MVSGSGKKPWRQKGTGRARVGEIRNPLWRKGGTVFGPQPRSYEFDLPKKVRRGALRAALAQKVQDGALVVVDKLEATEKKTKATAAMLKRLGATGKTLVIDVTPQDDFALTARNIAGLSVVAEQPRHRARRDGHDAGDRDARGDREAAGVAGIDVASSQLPAPSRDARRRSERLEAGSWKLETDHETDRHHPPPADHREDDAAARSGPDGRVRGGAPAPPRSTSSARSRSCSARRSKAVRTSISHGKFKRQGRFIGQRSDWKKAYVKLREGEKIPEFLEGA